MTQIQGYIQVIFYREYENSCKECSCSSHHITARYHEIHEWNSPTYSSPVPVDNQRVAEYSLYSEPHLHRPHYVVEVVPQVVGRVRVVRNVRICWVRSGSRGCGHVYLFENVWCKIAVNVIQSNVKQEKFGDEKRCFSAQNKTIMAVTKYALCLTNIATVGIIVLYNSRHFIK